MSTINKPGMYWVLLATVSSPVLDYGQSSSEIRRPDYQRGRAPISELRGGHSRTRRLMTKGKIGRWGELVCEHMMFSYCGGHLSPPDDCELRSEHQTSLGLVAGRKRQGLAIMSNINGEENFQLRYWEVEYPECKWGY